MPIARIMGSHLRLSKHALRAPQSHLPAAQLVVVAYYVKYVAQSRHLLGLGHCRINLSR